MLPLQAMVIGVAPSPMAPSAPPQDVSTRPLPVYVETCPVHLPSWILDRMPQHDRYYIISHSIHQDPMWIPVKKFIEHKLKAQTSKIVSSFKTSGALGCRLLAGWVAGV